jgi:hypothetical protein
MDINIDQSTPRGDLLEDKEGKFIYKINDERNEIDKFNRNFDQYKERRKEQMKLKMEAKLAELNKKEDDVPVYNKPLGEIIVNIKDTIFKIFDDILSFNMINSRDLIMKDNRLFYIGLLLLFIAVIMCLYEYSIDIDQNTKNIPKFIIELKTKTHTNTHTGAKPV